MKLSIRETKKVFTFFKISDLSILRELFREIERRGNFTKGITVTIEPKKSQRSLKQNKLFWKWIGEIKEQASDSTGKHFTSDYWHWYFCENFLEKKAVEGPNGSTITIQETTKNLGIRKFADLLQRIEICAVSDWGLELTRPDDFYWESLGVKKKTN